MTILYLCLSLVVLSVNYHASSVSVEAKVTVVLQLTRYGVWSMGI